MPVWIGIRVELVYFIRLSRTESWGGGGSVFSYCQGRGGRGGIVGRKGRGGLLCRGVGELVSSNRSELIIIRAVLGLEAVGRDVEVYLVEGLSGQLDEYLPAGDAVVGHHPAQALQWQCSTIHCTQSIPTMGSKVDIIAARSTNPGPILPAFCKQICDIFVF